MKVLGNKYLQLGEWCLHLFLLNCLWFMFSLIGGFFLGVFPATVALFAVLRKLTMEPEVEVRIFHLFWTTYKSEFIKGNLLGYVWAVIGGAILIDVRVLHQVETTFIHQALTIALYLLLVLYVFITFYLFPIFVHYNLRFLEYYKYAFVLVIGRPIKSILLFASMLLIYFLFSLIPGLIPVFGVSFIGFVMMKMTSSSLMKNNHSHIEEVESFS
ncbi:YesL family protein [Metabacillus halosaccharovorans]|uniref:YesL family protein n=1 Tax=Metabacillus halosaccharovorans TaxID=930124 RepID=UPI00099542A8|nr:DUF624 domain-containing protein [Metabacillus halosaccharovorans]